MTERSWSISSNRGWESFECKILNDHCDDLLCCLTLNGEYLDRSRPELSGGHLAPDFKVLLPQTILSRQSLRGLYVDLFRWREMGEFFSRDLQAASSGGQILRLSIEDNPRFIQSSGKRVFTIHYVSGLVMTITSSFLVDQSCVGLAVDELARSLGVGH